MYTKILKTHIKIGKKLLNFLLNYFSPNNKFIIFISQNLDILVAKRQLLIYINHKNNNSKYKSKLDRLNYNRQIA